MWLLLLSSIIWILILIYNEVYSFLPSILQGVKWLKIIAIISATIILICGVKQSIQDYRNYRFVYISSKDGDIIKKKNFPWEIRRIILEEEVVYIINERYGDASEISIFPEKLNDKCSIYNAADGIGIRFSCPSEEIPNFKIEIKK